MSTEHERSNFLALVAFVVAKTPTRIDEILRLHGRAGIEALIEQLDDERVAKLEADAERLTGKGISSIMRGDPCFPESLIYKERTSSPILYCWGNLDLLNSDGVGMCGSRSATDLGLKAAVACGEEVSKRQLSVISGYAKGVDTATHLAALRTGGNTVIVLAEGFDHFRVKSVFREQFDS